MSSSFLLKIKADTKALIRQREALVPLAGLQKEAALAKAPPSFLKALRQKAVIEHKTAVIAEVKRQSPSAGALNLTADPVKIARSYEASGAAAISVLTEPSRFKGSPDFLREVRKNLPKAALLQKDFFCTDYQFYEAKTLGASAVLLIVAMLSSEELLYFYRLTRDLGLTPLIEVHNAQETEAALALACPDDPEPLLIGVNNRNLTTLEIDVQTSFALSTYTQNSPHFFISESGLSRPEELIALRKSGFQGFLIGTALMQQATPGEALAALLAGTEPLLPENGAADES